MCYQDIIIKDGSRHLNENLICGINKGILENPINLNCGHSFCKECITTWLKIKKVCPLCMKDINYDINDRATNYILKNIIDNLEINCTEKTCDWSGNLGSLQNHYNECLFIKIKCKNSKCKHTDIRENMIKHELECDYQIVECDDCKIKMEKNMVNYHNDICLEKSFDCHHCKKKIKKIESLKHQKNCDYYIVECPYKHFGCTGTFYKKDLEQHLKDNYYHYTIHNQMVHYTDFVISKDNFSYISINNKIIKISMGQASNKKYCIFAYLASPETKGKLQFKVDVIFFNHAEQKFQNCENMIEYTCVGLENSTGYSIITFKNCSEYSDVEKNMASYINNGFLWGKISITEL